MDSPYENKAKAKNRMKKYQAVLKLKQFLCRADDVTMVQHSANGEISLYISYKSTNAQKYFSDDFYIQFIPNLVLESEIA